METMEQRFAVSFGRIFKKLDDLQRTSSGIEDRIIEDLGAVIRDQDLIKERMEVIEDETRLLPAISEDTDMIQEIMRTMQGNVVEIQEKMIDMEEVMAGEPGVFYPLPRSQWSEQEDNIPFQPITIEEDSESDKENEEPVPVRVTEVGTESENEFFESAQASEYHTPPPQIIIDITSDTDEGTDVEEENPSLHGNKPQALGNPLRFAVGDFGVSRHPFFDQ